MNMVDKFIDFIKGKSFFGIFSVLTFLAFLAAVILPLIEPAIKVHIGFDFAQLCKILFRWFFGSIAMCLIFHFIIKKIYVWNGFNSTDKIVARAYFDALRNIVSGLFSITNFAYMACCVMTILTNTSTENASYPWHFWLSATLALFMFIVVIFSAIYNRSYQHAADLERYFNSTCYVDANDKQISIGDKVVFKSKIYKVIVTSSSNKEIVLYLDAFHVETDFLYLEKIVDAGEQVTLLR